MSSQHNGMVGGVHFMMPMFSSLRIAIRSLARRPTVAAVAIVSLAVGIGVNSAVFSVVDSMFLKPPAVADPGSLVQVAATFKDSGRGVLDWSDCEDIAGQRSAFSAVTGTMGRGGFLREGGEMTMLLVDAVGDNYFEMLGVRPLLGQIPGAKYDYAADSEPPIVLSYWLWHERMGARPDAIGQRIEFRDHIWRIAAVLPPEFRGVDAMGQTHLWIPVSSWARYWPRDLERGGGQFEGLARLRPGVPLEQARAQLDALARNIEARDARVPKGRRLSATSIGAGVHDRLRPGILIVAVVSLVLLIACANVASVLLAYAESRRREIGLRVSLGAGRFTLLRQFLMESAVLATAGTGVGLLLASWLLNIVPALAPPSPVPLDFAFHIDLRVLAFTAAGALTTVAVFALAPLAWALRVSPAEAISGARTAGRSPRWGPRLALVTAQVALSVVLVGGAVVLTRALAEARAIYPGYDTSRPLALVWANVRSNDKPEDLVFREAARRMASVSGVEAVTWARHLPMAHSGGGASVSVVPEGALPGATPPRVYFNLVGPGFFEVAGVRMTSGRVFADSDHTHPSFVTVVSAEAARRFWPGRNPLGKMLYVRKDVYQVIGVAADGRINGLHEAAAPVIYLPSSRMKWGETIFVAKTKPDPSAIVKELGRAAAAGNDLRVFETLTLRTLIDGGLYDDWMPTVLGGFLAAVGLMLAAGGLYGAVSYSTERRLGEFGVRMALGARGAQVVALVLRQAVMLCVLGVPLGIGLFVAAHRYLGESLLRGGPVDAMGVAAGGAITAVTVLAGAVFPAMRAARLDPLDVLRAE